MSEEKICLPGGGIVIRKGNGEIIYIDCPSSTEPNIGYYLSIVYDIAT